MMRLAVFVCALGMTAARGWDEGSEQIDASMGEGAAAYQKADYEAARANYEKAWEIARRSPAGNPARYDILKRLAAIRAAQGEFAEADNYLQLAINWRETTAGADDPKIADDLLESATLCRGMTDYDRAMAILERVRSMHLRSAGAGSLPVASDWSRMAQIYVDEQNNEAAAAALEQALAIRSKIAGTYDVSLLGDLDRLGAARIALGRYEGAEESYRHALVIRESLFGRESPDLIATVDGLAYACFGEKKYEEAEPLYQRLIALWTSSAGKEHPMVAIAYDKLAVFYAGQKKFDLAKAAAEHANAIRAHFLASGFAQEAVEQQAENNVGSAKELYRRAASALQPPNPVYDELAGQIRAILENLEHPKPAPGAKAPRRSK